MDVDRLDRILERTLDDLRLSRGERRALTATLVELVERTRDLDLVRSRAFAVAAGSYNWTRSAAEENHEDLIVCNHPQLVAHFAEEFERLWGVFDGPRAPS